MDEQELINQYKILHKSRPYGISAQNVIIHSLPEIIKLKPTSILDYGCGQSDISKYISQITTCTEYVRYDPAIPGIDEMPIKKFDLVLCFDVMEHILEQDIEIVLKRILEKSHNTVFVISCRLASARLSNGMNAHVTVKDKNWWMSKIKNVFSNCSEINHRSARQEFTCKTF